MFRKHTMSKHMMATKAYHKLRELSRDKPNLCHVYDQDEAYYYGIWVTGLGYFDIKFPKETTRDLTQEEITHYESLCLQMSGKNLGKIKIIK